MRTRSKVAVDSYTKVTDSYTCPTVNLPDVLYCIICVLNVNMANNFPADIYALGRRYANVDETTNIDPMSAQLQEFYVALSSLFQPYTDAYHG